MHTRNETAMLDCSRYSSAAVQQYCCTTINKEAKMDTADRIERRFLVLATRFVFHHEKWDAV